MNHIVQSFWSGSVTTMERLCIRSFLANGHAFHLYAYGPLNDIPEGCIVKDANEILPEGRVRQLPCVQQWADFFRVALLLKKGGWWVDADTVCLKPYDFPSAYVFAASVVPDILQNCVMKVPAGSPIMQYWYDYINSMNPAQLTKLKFQDIGPLFLGKAVPKFGLQQYVQPRVVFDPIRYDKAAQMIDPTAVWDLTQTYSIHCFHAAWNNGHEAWARPDYKNLTDTNARFPAGCLYEQLKNRYLSGE